MEKKTDDQNATTRRSFLKSGAIATAAFMIVPRHVLHSSIKAVKQILDFCVM